MVARVTPASVAAVARGVSPRCLLERSGSVASVEVPEKYLIDTNIHDKLADDAEALELARKLVEAGTIELLTTHVQVDEIMGVSDTERVSKLVTVPARRVPTYGFVLGVSRLGEARLSEAEPYDSLKGDNPDHAEDAVIAATAQYEGATLVTEDTQLRGRATRHGIPVVDWATFRERLIELAG